MQLYASFVKFEADMHNINLLPIKGPPRKIHQDSFILIDNDVDTIFKLWPKEWHALLEEPLPEEKNVKEPPINQAHGEEKEGDDNQGDPSQESMEDDGDTEDSGQHPSTQLHAEE